MSIWGTLDSIKGAYKIDMPNSNIVTIWTIFSGMWLGVDLRTNTKKTYVSIGLSVQIMLTILRLHGQHDWENLYHHLLDTRIFTVIMNKPLIWTLKIMRQMTTGDDYDSLIILHNCVFHVLWEVVARRKESIRITHV